MGALSSVNSYNRVLGAGGAFIGPFEYIVAYSSVIVGILSNIDGSLYIDFSPDGVNVDATMTFPVTASIDETHRATVIRPYVRVRYVNGDTPQSLFRMTTMYGDQPQITGPLNTVVQQDAEAIAVRNIESELSIAEGKFAGYTVVNKFGRNPDVDAGSLPEDIWGGDGAYTGFPDSALETISVFSDSVDDAAAGTGARTIRITGLDSDYNVVTADVILNGTTPVATIQTFRRAHTAQVLTAGSAGVNAGTLTFRHTTTTANVFLMMSPGRNQTNNSAYTVPAGKTAFMRRLTSQIQGNVVAVIDAFIWTRAFGSVFRQRRPFTVSNNVIWVDEIYGGVPFTEKSDIVIRAAVSSASNVVMAAGYDLILVDNA